MIDQLPCGCRVITATYVPEFRHVSAHAANYFSSIGWPREKVEVVAWIDAAGVRTPSHRCPTLHRDDWLTS